VQTVNIYINNIDVGILNKTYPALTDIVCVYENIYDNNNLLYHDGKLKNYRVNINNSA
jgi:hypothetical protein